MKRTLLSFKVIILSVLALSAISFVVYLTHKQAQLVKSQVQQISQPNEEKFVVNALLQNVLALDNIQRNPNIANKDSSQIKISRIKSDIDSNLTFLKNWYQNYPEQVLRLDRVDSLIVEQSSLYSEYINLRAAYLKSDSVQTQIDRLNTFLKESYLKSDTSIFKQQSSISSSQISDTIVDSVSLKSTFWDRLFGRKKETSVKEVQHFILEQMKMSVDTLQLMQDDSIIDAFAKEINLIQQSRKKTLNDLNQKRFYLDQANAQLITEVVNTLHSIEMESNALLRLNNGATIQAIDDSLNALSLLLLLFIIVIILLGLWIYWDIYKANQYKQMIESAKEHAEQEALARQQFLSNMSHELRTPLQSIIGYSELMHQESNNAHTQSIVSASKHLLGVVNQVLDFNRLLSGHFLLHATSFNLSDILKEIKALIDIQILQKGLNLEWQVPQDNNILLIGDSLRIKQIILNLLQNAVKFTNEGFIKFDLSCIQNINTTQLLFSVTDTGLGIKESELEQIFNAFEQATNHHYTTGSGLGLSIVKQLVELMDGTILISSKVGEGSKFSVTLTLYNSQSNEIQNHLFNFKLNKKTEGIIIIDDDVLISNYCETLLRQTDVLYQIFNHPTEFIRNEVISNVDVILMDIRMPEISGYDLIRQVKNKYSNAAFIAFTAQVMPDEIQLIQESGFDGILQKPFLQEDFYNKLGIKAVNSTIDANDIKFLIEVLKADVEEMKNLWLSGKTDELINFYHNNASRLGQYNFNTLSQQMRNIEIALKNGKTPIKLIQQSFEALESLILQHA